MTSTEISEVTKLIREIRSKLNEIERKLGKSPSQKFSFPINKISASPRKRNPYRNSENNGNQ